MSSMTDEIRAQLEVRRAALERAELDGDGLQVAVLRGEIEDLEDLALRHERDDDLRRTPWEER